MPCANAIQACQTGGRQLRGTTIAAGEDHCVRRRSRAALTLATMLLCALTAFQVEAIETPAVRACVRDDLSGTFRLVDYREIPKGKIISGGNFTGRVSTFPYYLLNFYPDGDWATMAFNRQPNSLKQALKYLQHEKHGAGYMLQPDGQIELRGVGRAAFVGRCQISLGTTGGYLANDLILSGYEADSRDEQHRLFRSWTGGDIPRAVSAWDPAPWADAVGSVPGEHATNVAIQATLPKEPTPVQLDLKSDGPDGNVWLYATNAHHAPLSAFTIGKRDASTDGKWQTVYVDACLGHHSAWQPGAQWSQQLGIRIAVRKVEVQLEAAIFTDGSTWGDPQRLGELKVHRGNCQWPGS
jgi:hypothetical protein